MQEAWQKAEEASQTDAPVLLWGKTGTGKDLMAHYIHERSSRAGRPLIKLDCTTLPGGLVESELFGYEKGAFTDAHHTKPGIVESAHRSTLFLNEVSNIPLPVQAKLLGVLEEGTFRRLGGIEERRVDFRLISATNRDLRRMIREGSFREDLYYRLHRIEIYLPPLRERREDILPLVDFYMRTYCQQYGREVTLSEEAREALVNYSWGGNVRELMGVVEDLVVLRLGDVILPEHLPSHIVEESGRLPSLRQAVQETERRLILQALGITNSNKTQAARILGISLNTLKAKMRFYGINREGPVNF